MTDVIIPENEDAGKAAVAYRLLLDAFEEIRKMGGRITPCNNYILRNEEIEGENIAITFGSLKLGETRAIYRRVMEVPKILEEYAEWTRGNTNNRQEIIHWVKKLHYCGVHIKDIAFQFDVTPKTIRRWLNLPQA